MRQAANKGQLSCHVITTLNWEKTYVKIAVYINKLTTINDSSTKAITENAVVKTNRLGCVVVMLKLQ